MFDKFHAIEKAYRVVCGIVREPCAFEGEPIWVPFLWRTCKPTEINADGERCYEVTRALAQICPQLRDARAVVLSEDSEGFVYSKVCNVGQYEEWRDGE